MAGNENFVKINGELFYKIEDYDLMEDFFMTITSSSDVWNFCWSQGGVTAGRMDANHAVFPYYTADKVSDAKTVTGPYTLLAVNNGNNIVLWEPFASLSSTPAVRAAKNPSISRTIYKNTNGTEVIFEEKNADLGLTFRYAWTSSDKFGIVRRVQIENTGAKAVEFSILDGCQNIMPAGAGTELQNNSSVLLDAYKQSDMDRESALALFSLSSVVSDKAEPSECLVANTCWFTSGITMISPDSPMKFALLAKNSLPQPQDLAGEDVVKGKRASCFVCKKETLSPGAKECWSQVFDTFLDSSRVADLKKLLANRDQAARLLEEDIASCKREMDSFIAQADGMQDTADKMSCVHHSANVMFNIMRGGIFADGGKISLEDFMRFVSQRNTSLIPSAEKMLAGFAGKKLIKRSELVDAAQKFAAPLLLKLALEYMPLTFSRRHGDPSRPWNKFNIKLRDEFGNKILNYEGNWRDIFQNWEALSYSYPEYTPSMICAFLNNMTFDGFNPYRIFRGGLDWEVPDPNNPWAFIGYWGDHQVIYLQKLLERQNELDKDFLNKALATKLFSSAAVPYRIKDFASILKNPRDTIAFDREASNALIKAAKERGGDAKLVASKDGSIALVTLTQKLLQIVISKAANLVPGGGIWLNTQRPEWNDANNALAGWGLSVVTSCYLNRYLTFLQTLFAQSQDKSFTVTEETALAFKALTEHFAEYENYTGPLSAGQLYDFVCKSGLIFEKERNSLYNNGFGKDASLTKDEILRGLTLIKAAVVYTVRLNKRSDGLYHSYNVLVAGENSFGIKYLQEMLEGQVAVLSSHLLGGKECVDLLKALRSSRIYEQRQNSYMLYPNKELPKFEEKNNVPASDVQNLKEFVDRSKGIVIGSDQNGCFHFNSSFLNARVMQEFIQNLPDGMKPSAEEEKELLLLYEKTFNHSSFTGRSGTFYAYEGLGSIYWHMVSKLLLAVQENVDAAFASADSQMAKELASIYYDVRSGLGFNKTPQLYGAFPQDPYSHTPSMQGAKQPGMTGQVKEEVITRSGELGVRVEHSCLAFKSLLLRKTEFKDDSTLEFTVCGTKVKYILSDQDKIEVETDVGKVERTSTSLTPQESQSVFARDGRIKGIKVFTTLKDSLV